MKRNTVRSTCLFFDGIFKDSRPTPPLSPLAFLRLFPLSVSLPLFQTTPALALHSALLVPYNGVFVFPFVRRVILPLHGGGGGGVPVKRIDVLKQISRVYNKPTVTCFEKLIWFRRRRKKKVYQTLLFFTRRILFFSNNRPLHVRAFRGARRNLEKIKKDE